MEKGIFITFEGNEGSGKTTITNRIYKQLKEEGYSVMLTREPGGIEIAEQIREVILNTNNTKMDARCEALLYAAARRQHLVEKVIPALNEGVIVLCDRFIDSSLAYQGVARGLGMDEIMSVNAFAIQDTMPKLTVLLQVNVKEGMKRVHAREEALNRLDKESMDFHEAVSKGYEEVSKRYPKRIQCVDANRSEEEVYAEVLAIVKKGIQDD